MEWWVLLAGFFVALIVLALLRIPIAYALLLLNVVAALYFFGFGPGLRRIVVSLSSAPASFVLLPVPLFILMGEVLMRCGVVDRVLTVVDRLIGRVPARLPMLATASGTLLGILSGSTMANTAVLGKSLLPRMIASGYSRQLSTGSILASGGLAMIIPPSALAVVWGATAGVSVGAILIAGILPGLLMAVNYVIVILVWAHFFGGAPPSEPAPRIAPVERLKEFVLYVLPLGLIVFLVIGLIFLGVATPSESAALGVAGAVVIAMAYRRATLSALRDSLFSTAKLTSMIFFIVVASGIYSQLMSFSGATSGMVEWLTNLPLAPLGVLIVMQLCVLFLGLFLEQISIMLVTLPFFMPVVASFGWDPVWFGIIMLINLQLAGTTPPFGMLLFVMKGVAPKDVRLTDIYKGALPFVVADFATMGVVMAFPILALWLPAVMQG